MRSDDIRLPDQAQTTSFEPSGGALSARLAKPSPAIVCGMDLSRRLAQIRLRLARRPALTETCGELVKRLVQSLSNGKVSLIETPRPAPGPGEVLIETRLSLISPGTERMLLEFGRSNWVEKARQQPDKVRQTLEKVQTDGLMATLDAVRSKLDQPIALGYCNVGRVVEIGAEVAGLKPGDRVVSNGAHAELVTVPKNLVQKIPEGVEDQDAAFAVLGAIGLQGMRLAAPALGEAVAVIGLGLVGLLTVQMLRAQGCRVLGLDPDEGRRNLAEALGAATADTADFNAALKTAMGFSRGRGVDAVLIAAATQSDEPVSLAARMSRQRGRIVLIGVSGLKLSRADFFEKELTFQVSHSYGPGRRDPNYEEKGQDYPAGLVRWTEQRNFEAVLDLMDAGALDLAPLVTHQIDFQRGPRAYDLLGDMGKSLAILLDYPLSREGETLERRLRLKPAEQAPATPRVAFIGMGNYASRVLAPAFKAAGASLGMAVSAQGLSASHHGQKLGFAEVSTDLAAALESPEIDTVVIATRHNNHADLAVRALEAGKHVWVEKPLALKETELDGVMALLEARPDLTLTVGFNRRFAPLVTEMQGLLAGLAMPKTILITVNAGLPVPGSWVTDPAIGGGRMVGEGCHFIDLARYLAGHRIDELHADPGPEGDDATVTLRFHDGARATIQYLSSGHAGFPKERVEVFAAGRVLQLDNFRTLRGWGWPGFRTRRKLAQDKGQTAMATAFCAALKAGRGPIIPYDELIEVAAAGIDAEALLR